MRFEWFSSLLHSAYNTHRETRIAHLFLIFLPNFEHFLVRKANAIHSLKRIVFRISQPVCCGVTSSGKSLDLASVRDMWATTQVNQVSTLVDSRTSSIGNLGGQDGLFERVVGKQFQRFFFGNHHSLKLLFGLYNLGDLGLDRFICFAKKEISNAVPKQTNSNNSTLKTYNLPLCKHPFPCRNRSKSHQLAVVQW